MSETLNKRNIFVSTASQIIVRFVTLAITLFSIKWLTNYLGAAGIGEYNTITTYVNIFIVVADLGLFSVTVREIAKDPAREKKLLSNALGIRIVTALIATIIAVCIVFLTKYDQNIKMGTLFASGFIFFNLLASIYDVVLQYRLKMQYSAISEFISKIIYLITLYLVILFHGSFIMVISTVTLSGIMTYLFKYMFARKYIRFAPENDKKLSGWLISMAWPIGIVFIMNNIFFKIDSIILYIMKGAVPTGIYSVAYKILEVTVFIGSYFASSLKPAISKYIHSDKQLISNIISKGLFFMLLAAIPISSISIVFAKDIILFLSNSEFLPGTGALVILSIALPFIYFDMLLGEILLAHDERKLLIKISLSMLLFNLITNILIIPIYSFIGAAWVTLVSEVLLFVINLYYVNKLNPFKIVISQYLKAFLVAAVLIVVGMSLTRTGINFLLSISLCGGLYIVLLYIFKIITVDQLKSLKNEK